MDPVIRERPRCETTGGRNGECVWLSLPQRTALPPCILGFGSVRLHSPPTSRCGARNRNIALSSGLSRDGPRSSPEPALRDIPHHTSGTWREFEQLNYPQ